MFEPKFKVGDRVHFVPVTESVQGECDGVVATVDHEDGLLYPYYIKIEGEHENREYPAKEEELTLIRVQPVILKASRAEIMAEIVRARNIVASVQDDLVHAVAYLTRMQITLELMNKEDN